MKTLPILLITLLFSCSENKTTKEQSTSTIINKTGPLIKETVEGYFAVYHFGESEMETNLIINGDNGKYYAQIRSGSFNDDATAWVNHYENLKNVKIEGNKFFSDKTNGKFIVTKNGKQGLNVEKSWSTITNDNGSELGIISSKIENYYAGTYKEASLKLLTIKELRSKTKAELVLMRNEIFARYGYQFQSGGAMDNYFKAQKWYETHYKNVANFLTWLEKENINLIKKEEANCLDKEDNISLEEFPKEWIKITQQEGKYVILKPCLAYNKGFIIKQDRSGTWHIDVLEDFDTKRYAIINFELIGSLITQEYRGTLLIEDSDAVPLVQKKCFFTWYRLKNYGEIEGLYNNKIRMISGKIKSDYVTIQEECDEDETY